MGRKALGSFQKLFEPGSIGKVKLMNRLVRASMWTAYGGSDGSVTERLLRHYRELAKGGVGLVMVEYANNPLAAAFGKKSR